MYRNLSTLFAPHRSRPQRRFASSWLGDSVLWKLESRNLTAPAFYRASPYFTGTLPDQALIATADSFVSIGPVGSDDHSATGDTGANTASDLTGTDPTGGESVEEEGIVTSSVNGPASDPASNTQAILTKVTHAHTDTVTIPSGQHGGGNATEFSENTMAETNGFLQWDLKDPSGGTMSGTITVFFTANMTPPQQGFTDGAFLAFRSTYLNVDVGSDTDPYTLGTGITATDPATGTVLQADPNFGTGTVPSTFTLQFNVNIPPNTTSLPIFEGYLSQFLSAPASGKMSGGTHVQQSSFSWTFSMTANP